MLKPCTLRAYFREPKPVIKRRDDVLDMSARRIHVRSACRESTQISQALLKAVQHGKVRAVTAVLDDPAVDVNIRDDTQTTPLLSAIALDKDDVRTHIVRLLVRKGVDVNCQDNYRRSCLGLTAMTPGLDDVTRLLIRKGGCDPNAADLDGNTPLHLAVNANNASFIRILINCVAVKNVLDVGIANNDGLTPLMLAFKLRLSKCCQVLVHEAGADTSSIVNKEHLKALLSNNDNSDSGMLNRKSNSSVTSKTSLRLDRISLHSKGSCGDDSRHPQLKECEDTRDDVFSETVKSNTLEPIASFVKKESTRTKNRKQKYLSDEIPKSGSPSFMTDNRDGKRPVSNRQEGHKYESGTLPLSKVHNPRMSLENPTFRQKASSVPPNFPGDARMRDVHYNHFSRENSLQVLPDLRIRSQHSFESLESSKQRPSLQPISTQKLSMQSQKLMASMQPNKASLLPTIRTNTRVNLVSNKFNEHRERSGTL